MSEILKHSTTRPAGYTETVHADGRVEVHETRQCCHCGRHWQIKPGSGKVRGFCTSCMGYTCGHKNCDPCYPYEKQLDDLEKHGKLCPPS